ncbi:hypothetical protein TL16_g11975 [Triparma laevis f. inornata]|uniref:Transmembrane protein 131-like N-terminal domain-containing protein n=1 Tax=Triparma laevis f. inornata TaxID=1714386 RepID=A0A9W7BHC6_9STRA|nr:hypothetical protein TL16_g11975 [Triparma laevis f. inornata]
MPSPRLFLLLLIPSFLLISIFSSSLETVVPPSNTLQHVGDGFRVTSPDILVGTECEPVVSELIVENTNKKEITLLSLSSTTSDVHLPLFDSKTLQPGTTESLKVVYLPNKPGPSMTTFTLLTSSTPLTFPLYTLSHPSPLNLHPTTITSIGGETVTKLFSLKGIFDVMSYEGSTSSIIVQCNEEGTIQDPVFKVDVKIPSNLGEKHLGWITLKLIPEGYDDSKTYIIPLTTVTVSDLVLPEYLDFGILTSPKDSATLPIKMYNPFPHDLKLSNVKSDKSEFKVLKPSHTSSILPSREEREILVIFDVDVEGFVEGEIEVSGNFTSKTVKVRGQGKWGGVAWRDEDIIIKKGASVERHSLEIFNVFKDDVLLHNVTSACSGVEIQEYEKVEKGHMQFWNVNFLTKGALNISNPITDENTDCGIWVTTAFPGHVKISVLDIFNLHSHSNLITSSSNSYLTQISVLDVRFSPNSKKDLEYLYDKHNVVEARNKVVVKGEAVELEVKKEFTTPEETFKVAVIYESVMGEFEVGVFDFENYFKVERGSNEKLSNLYFTPTPKLDQIYSNLNLNTGITPTSNKFPPRTGSNFFSLNPSNPFIHKLYMHRSTLTPTLTKSGDTIPTLSLQPILRTGLTSILTPPSYDDTEPYIDLVNEINRENCAPMIKTKAETAGEVEVEKRAYTAVLKFLNTMKEQRTENAVTSHQLTTWKDAKNAWYEYEKYDLNIIATGITVTPEVSEPPTSPPLIVTSRLSIPKINLARHEEVVFDNTRVGSEGIGYIYVENPTADPITVSIVQPNNDEGCWIQAQKKMANSWYTGGSWFMLMQSDHTPILQAGYGSSVRTPPGTPTMKSVHGISMLLRGCGRRCGVKGETTTPTALFAPITPISTENEEGSMYRITKPQPFAVSFDAFKTVMLEPYQVKRVGPLFFKPWGQGDFNSDLYIKNDITGLEKVTLRGRGVSNFLAFSALPQSEGGSSSDVISWEGEKMLRFEPGLPTYDGSAHVTKFIRLSNQGGHPIHIQHIELQSQRNPSASLIFTFSKPFGIFNLFPPFDYEYLVPYMEKIKELMGPQWGYPGWGGTPAACQSRGYRIVNCEAAQTHFTLENEEYIDIEIQHHPECGEPFSYTHLNVNMVVEETFYGRPETGLYVESRAFKVGHAASEADMEYCISSLDVLKYQLRYVTVFITCLFIFMAFFYLYFVSLDVLYRHDYMLRVEATWQKPIISCYDELQSDLKHITSTNPDITQLDLWVKTKVKDMMSTRTTPPTRAVPQPKLVIPKRFFGNLENHDEDTDFIKATLAPVGVDVDNANHNTAYASSPATRKFTTALKSSSWRAHLAKSRGNDPNPIGCMPPSAFPAFFATMKASYHTSHLATNPNNSKSVTFRTSSSSFDDEEGEEGAGAGTPPRLVTGSSKSSLKMHPSSSSSPQVGNSGYVRSTSGSLSKEERRALAVEQQRQALTEKEARREEDEILKRAAAAKKKLKKEQEEEAQRQEILAKIKGEEEFLAAQRLAEEEAALKILEQRQRQEDEEEQSAIMAAKKESLEMEKERIEREKALADERKRAKEEAREAKRSKLLARSLAEKEATKKLKEEARLKRETELKKKKAEKKAKKLELELKKEQEKQLNKVKALIIKQKGVAEVQWLIAMSLTNEAGIKGVFTSPSNVARFCILHSDFELRREANMDFIVMNLSSPLPGTGNEGMSLENLLGGRSGITSAGLAELPRRSSSGISDNDKIGGDTLGGSDNFDMMNLLPTDIADFVMEDNEGDLWNSNSITPPTASGGLGRGSGSLGGLGRDLGGLGGVLGSLTGSTLLTPDSLLAGLNSTSMDKEEKKNSAGSTVQRSDGNGIYKSSGNSFFE